MSAATEHTPLITPDPENAPGHPVAVAETHAIDTEPERFSDPGLHLLASVGILTFVVTTWTIVFTHDVRLLSWFAFHPTLQSLGIALFTFGILTLQPTSRTYPQAKLNGLFRHQVYNFWLGFPLIIAGFSFIFYNKAAHGAPHFTTWHSTFGLIAFIWLVLHVIFGGASVWFGGAVLGGGDTAKAFYKYHRVSGYLLLIMLYVTAYLAGSWSDWFINNTNVPERIIGYGVAPLLVVFAVYYRVRFSKMAIL